MEVFIGTIMPVGFNFAPKGWAFCNGQLMSIAQNSALFSLLGTMYGGDGVQTFGLPDLRGRVVVGSQAQGPGLMNVAQGEMAGVNNVTVIGNGTAQVHLTAANVPAHTHPATMTMSGLTATTTLSAGTAGTGGAGIPAAGSVLTGATSSGGAANIYLPAGTAPTAPVDLGGISTTVTGSGTVTVDANTGGQPLVVPVVTQAQTSVMQPYTGLNFIIATEGIYPSRP
jgi:microcystin-dependent protein